LNESGTPLPLTLAAFSLQPVFPIARIHEKAERLGLGFLVIGGHAVNVYCAPRATLDVDFLARKDDRQRWCALLIEEGFRLQNESENFLQFSPPYGIRFRLDLMLVNDATFSRLRESAQRAACLGVEVLIPTVLHLVALKLHAIRHGPVGRKGKDWLDIENLVRGAGIDPVGPEMRELFDHQGTPELYSEFRKRFEATGTTDELNEPGTPYAFDALDLPVAPTWFSEPPQGSMEDGFHLSLMAIEQVRNRAEIFVERERQRCNVEFLWRT